MASNSSGRSPHGDRQRYLRKQGACHQAIPLQGILAEDVPGGENPPKLRGVAAAAEPGHGHRAGASRLRRGDVE